MLVRFVSLEHGLGRVMQQIMAETLTSGTSKERHDQLEAVRQALLTAWPTEIRDARERTSFQPGSQGGVIAMFCEDDDAAAHP